MGTGGQGRSLIGGPWHPHPMRLSTSGNHTSGLSRRQSVLDTIDEEFSRQRVSDRKGPKPIKILLLAHPASPPQATSHKLLVPTLGQEVYPPLTADHLKLKMRLAPLGQVEAALISKIPPFPSQSNLPSRSFVPPRSMHQLKFRLDERLKQDNGRRGQSEELRNSRYDRLGRPACAEVMKRLWSDPIIKRLMEVERTRSEELQYYLQDCAQTIQSQRSYRKWLYSIAVETFYGIEDELDKFLIGLIQSAYNTKKVAREIALTAVLSTLDAVYERHCSASEESRAGARAEQSREVVPLRYLSGRRPKINQVIM
ncbi:hypothetical protein EDC04DRAFT_2614478 [Pisolithus marmoratus]|nr:hypothetical protein EDC04DRAFT_2614478 [Pisolithus marmoratus]